MKKNALEIVKKLDSELTIESIRCQYMGKNKNSSSSAYIDVIVYKNDKEGIILSYSFETKMFSYISQWEDVSEYLQDYRSRAKRKQCKVFEMVFDESNVAEKEAK